MDKKIISHRIGDVLNNLSRLNNNLCAMDSVDIQRYPDNYETMSTEAALKAEKIACQLRSLLYASTSVSKEEYLIKASEAQGVAITEENGIVAVTLPRLLPRKRSKQSNLFLLEPLGTALAQYTKEHPTSRFRECVVCISHMYDHELPDWCLLDYDNLQQKQLLDMIALYLMVDDSGLLCDTYHTSELGDRACTRVYLMDKNSFTGWLLQREKALKSISDF